jgi:hypothetical protein
MLVPLPHFGVQIEAAERSSWRLSQVDGLEFLGFRADYTDYGVEYIRRIAVSVVLAVVQDQAMGR